MTADKPGGDIVLNQSLKFRKASAPKSILICKAMQFLVKEKSPCTLQLCFLDEGGAIYMPHVQLQNTFLFVESAGVFTGLNRLHRVHMLSDL